MHALEHAQAPHDMPFSTQRGILACWNVDEVSAIRCGPVFRKVVDDRNVSRALDLTRAFHVHIRICTVIVRLDVVALLVFPWGIQSALSTNKDHSGMQPAIFTPTLTC